MCQERAKLRRSIYLDTLSIGLPYMQLKAKLPLVSLMLMCEENTPQKSCLTK